MSTNPASEELAYRRWWKQFKDGIQQGIAASPEDRREMLTAVREIEGKAEGPRALYTLAQNPLIDLVRQENTFENRTGIGSLGLPQLSDEAILHRANAGLLIGPKPQDVIPKEDWYMGESPLPADPRPLPGEVSS